jgi:eukaryotic-like serine/threonine-protein kinase
MLTRQVPFTGSSPVAIAYKHVKEDPILPSRLNADIPPALEAIVMKALAKNPDNRYQSAQEMRHDLMRAAAGKPVQATPLMAPVEQTGIAATTRGGSDETVMIPRTGGPPAQVARRRRLGWTLLSLIMLAIAGIVAWAIISSLPKTPASVAVPNVVNKPVDEAKTIISRAGFRPIVEQQTSDTVKAGLVISQDPDPQTSLKKGSDVTLFVSLGRGNTTVPDLKGLTKDQAITKLEGEGLQLGRVLSGASTEADRGKVIGQSVPAGQRIERSSKIDIRVGTGPEKATVPNVVGMSEADARAALDAAGFKVATKTSSSGACLFAPPGQVCDQSPEGSTQADKGSTVTITVREGETSSPSPTPTDTPT